MKATILGFALLAFTLAPARADQFKIEPSHSTMEFSVHQFLGTTRGKFTQFSGKIDLNREQPEHSSVNAHIRVASIDTRIRKRDDHLLSAEFFNAEKYPEIVFQSRSIKKTGDQNGDITGDFTMHGVTKPITLHVKLMTPLKDEAAMQHSRWEVTTEPLKRRDFGLMFSGAAESVSGIGQEVAIKIEIEAIKAP